MNKSIFTESILLIVAAIISFVALNLVAGDKIDLNNLAKGKENTSIEESYKGSVFTACNISDIETMVHERSSKRGVSRYCNEGQRILWLGNSQLHYINQYKDGDHLSPYWLRVGWDYPDCFEPLGFSLPNADLQEYFVLSQYVVNNVAIDGLILELVFDDLREAGLRDEFSNLLSKDLVESIRKRFVNGASIVNTFTSSDKGTGDSRDILAGTIQKPVESWLTKQMNNHWRLWADRSQIEGDFLVSLFYVRNWVFGIKPTSERKMIKARYDLNMKALAEILADYQQRGVPVVLYIAPIRQDYPIPYNLNEYSRWKGEVKDIAQRFGATLLNFEKLVPDDEWGSNTNYKDDIDFMHFRGPGHRIVAASLLPYVKRLVEEGCK